MINTHQKIQRIYTDPISKCFIGVIGGCCGIALGVISLPVAPLVLSIQSRIRYLYCALSDLRRRGYFNQIIDKLLYIPEIIILTSKTHVSFF